MKHLFQFYITSISSCLSTSGRIGKLRKGKIEIEILDLALQNCLGPRYLNSTGVDWRCTGSLWNQCSTQSPCRTRSNKTIKLDDSWSHWRCGTQAPFWTWSKKRNPPLKFTSKTTRKQARTTLMMMESYLKPITGRPQRGDSWRNLIIACYQQLYWFTSWIT